MNSQSQAGALAANARRDVYAHAAQMRRAYRDSFRTGHRCSLCPPIEIPSGVSGRDRDRRAAALWRLHWIRMRHERGAKTRHRAARRARS